MRLSLASWSLPACILPEVAGISRALGINAVDVGLHYRSALSRDEILSDPLAVAERVKSLGVDLPNYYHQFGTGIAGQNLSLPGTAAQNVADIAQVLRFADAAGIGSVFNNISLYAQLIGGNDDRYVTWRKMLAPTFVDRATNTWIFDRPCLIKTDEAIRLVASDEAVNATTDVYAAFHGFTIGGLSADEVRECIALGLFSAWARSGD